MFQDREIHFVSVSNLHNSSGSTANPVTLYEDLFRTYNDHYCNRCLQVTPQQQSLFYEIPPENHYICMVIHNVYLATIHFKPLLIERLDPNNILFYLT